MRAGERFVNVIRVVSCCGPCLDYCSASRHRPAVSGPSSPPSRTQLNRTDPPLHPSQTVLVLPCGLSGLSRRTPCLAQIWNTQQHYYTVRHTCKPVVKTTPSQTSPHSWDVSRFELCIIATDFAIRIASAMGTTQIPAHIWRQIHDWCESQYNDPFTPYCMQHKHCVAEITHNIISNDLSNSSWDIFIGCH